MTAWCDPHNLVVQISRWKWPERRNGIIFKKEEVEANQFVKCLKDNESQRFLSWHLSSLTYCTGLISINKEAKVSVYVWRKYYIYIEHTPHVGGSGVTTSLLMHGFDDTKALAPLETMLLCVHSPRRRQKKKLFFSQTSRGYSGVRGRRAFETSVYCIRWGLTGLELEAEATIDLLPPRVMMELWKTRSETNRNNEWVLWEGEVRCTRQTDQKAIYGF